MTRVLATTITRNCARRETSGYLYTVDIDEGVVLGRSPIVEAPLREFDDNPRGGMRGGRGIAVNGDEAYVANFSRIHRYDSVWRLTSVIGHPACADIHDIALHDGTLWVTSTRNDLLFQFLPDGTLRDCINVRTLEPVQELLEPNGIPEIDPRSAGIDFRDPRTHDPSIFDQTHLNGVAFGANGDMFLSLGKFGVNGHAASALLSLAEDGTSAAIGMLNGADVPRHNVVPLSDGTVLLNDTPAGAVVHFSPHTNGELLRVDVNRGYLRGLLQLEDGRLIVGAQNKLVVARLHHEARKHTIQLSPDSRESVHSIAALSEGTQTLPVAFDHS